MWECRWQTKILRRWPFAQRKWVVIAARLGSAKNGDHKEHSTVCLSNLSANSVLDIDWAVYSLCSILEIVLVFADPVRASVHLHRPLDSLLLNPLECTVGLAN